MHHSLTDPLRRLRRPFLLGGALLLGFTSRAAAQGKGASFDLGEARTPSSPAFVLLGVEPTAVERPNTPRALAVSLINATQQGDVIPRNFALEFAPYWLKGHPDLTFDKYYHAGFLQTVQQSLSVSLATARQGDSAQAEDTATVIGLGLRSLLVAGTASPRLAGERRHLQEVDDAFVILIDSLDRVREALAQLPSGSDCDAACDRERRKAGEAVTALLSDSAKAQGSARDIALRIQELDHHRVGWQVEMAAAISGRFPGDSWEDAEVGRIGVWLTPSYRPRGDNIDFIAVGRFIRSLRTGAEASFLDAGGRVRWENGPLMASGEFVYRSRNEKSGPTTTSVRLVGELDYRVSEDVHVTGSFGKNYDGDTPDAKRLVAQLGIDFGVGKLPLINLAK